MERKHVLILLAAFLIAFLLMLCTGCKTRYLPMEKTKIEYITRDSIRVDSTFVHDSVYIRERGETITVFKYKYIDRYKYINKTDTVLKTDTTLITRVQTVEKSLSWWQKLRINLGGVTLIAIFIVIVSFILKRFRIDF